MANPVTLSAGTQLVGSSDIAVGTAGAATRVFAVHIISSGGGAAVVSLRNGTSASDTIYLTLTGTTSTGATFAFGTNGFLFPSGCFVDVDTNTTSVAVAYGQ